MIILIALFVVVILLQFVAAVLVIAAVFKSAYVSGHADGLSDGSQATLEVCQVYGTDAGKKMAAAARDSAKESTVNRFLNRLTRTKLYPLSASVNESQVPPGGPFAKMRNDAGLD